MTGTGQSLPFRQVITNDRKACMNCRLIPGSGLRPWTAKQTLIVVRNADRFRCSRDLGIFDALYNQVGGRPRLFVSMKLVDRPEVRI